MVFVDKGERPWRDARPNRPAPPAHAGTQADLPKRAPIQRPKPPMASAPASSLGCLAGLVRLALFVIVVWYVGRWLLSIPEVSRLVSALRSGAYSDDQVSAAFDAVRTHLLQLVGVSPASPRQR